MPGYSRAPIQSHKQLVDPSSPISPALVPFSAQIPPIVPSLGDARPARQIHQTRFARFIEGIPGRGSLGHLGGSARSKLLP